VLNRTGEFDEALAVADRLDAECGDIARAETLRAAVYLNTGRYADAAETARGQVGAHPCEGFIVALALVEIGDPDDREEAMTSFLLAALHHPRAARMLCGIDMPAPASAEQGRDHLAGIDLEDNLEAFLDGDDRDALRLFGRALGLPSVTALLDLAAVGCSLSPAQLSSARLAEKKEPLMTANER